jgi:hypothetical protein
MVMSLTCVRTTFEAQSLTFTNAARILMSQVSIHQLAPYRNSATNDIRHLRYTPHQLLSSQGWSMPLSFC